MYEYREPMHTAIVALADRASRCNRNTEQEYPLGSLCRCALRHTSISSTHQQCDAASCETTRKKQTHGWHERNYPDVPKSLVNLYIFAQERDRGLFSPRSTVVCCSRQAARTYGDFVCMVEDRCVCSCMCSHMCST